MRNLTFHAVRAKNILCFGPDGINIEFSNHGNIVLVKGINLDAPASDGKPASNGAGKSSIQELLSIGLFGKTVKSPKKNKGNKIVNVLATKAEVEVEWDDYKVLRTYHRQKSGTIRGGLRLWRNPDRIFDDTTEITYGGDPERVQTEIERVLGLNHHAFCNVIIFDDSNSYAFLELELERKREIVENLLDLQQYREYLSNCKDLIKQLNKRISELSKEYSTLQDSVDTADKRMTLVRGQEETWRKTKQSELVQLNALLSRKLVALKSTDSGAQLANWMKSQERIKFLADEITDLESKRDKLNELITLANSKLETARNDKQTLTDIALHHSRSAKESAAEMEKAHKLLHQLEHLQDGASCPFCYGTITKANYAEVMINARASESDHRNAAEHEQSLMLSQQEKVKAKAELIKTIEEKTTSAQSKVTVLEGTMRKHRQELSELSKVSKPEGTTQEQVLEAEVTQVQNQIAAKQTEIDGPSPYQAIIIEAEGEVTRSVQSRDAKKVELKTAEDEMPYYEYWANAFGDNGIRKFVIDGIMPSLNSRINYWLQILIDGLIELQFDSTFDETISRKGNPAFYTCMSNGEIRRINLAISQAFAYVMMLNSGHCPSILFLDEITGGGIDHAGIPFVYNMINELAKDRQVFVTTHNEYLNNLLQGCDSLTLKKQDDITVLV